MRACRSEVSNFARQQLLLPREDALFVVTIVDLRAWEQAVALDVEVAFPLALLLQEVLQPLHARRLELHLQLPCEIAVAGVGVGDELSCATLNDVVGLKVGDHLRFVRRHEHTEQFTTLN